MHLRSVELDVPDSAAAAAFFKSPWGLIDVGSRNGVTYLRGTAAHAYIVPVKDAATSAFASATFSGTKAEVETLYAAVQKAGLPHGAWVDEFDEPGRGAGFYVTGPEGEPYRFLTEKDVTEKLPSQPQHPLQLAHVVFNTRDREGGTRTLTDVFGFKLSDRTRVMNFLRCDKLHHAIAYADAK